MTVSVRAADTLIILAVILLAWQALHQAVGATALPAPLPTLAYLVKFLTTARFAANAWATLVSFAVIMLTFWGIMLLSPSHNS